MSDAQDYSHVWEARHFSNPAVYDNVRHKLTDIDFEDLHQFTLYPKEGVPVPQAIAVFLPPKAKADYRLIFRFMRNKDMNAGQMLPASFVVGLERSTPENCQILSDIEAGKAIEPKDFPPTKDGFLLHVFPSGDIEAQGAYRMHPVAKDGIVTIFLGPLGEY